MNFSVVELKDYDLSLLNELIELQKEAFGDLGLDKGTLPLMIRCGRVFILKKDNKVIGSAEFMKDWSDPKCAFLVGFSISEEEKQKGRGKYFMKEILNRLPGQLKTVRLTTSSENEAALGLYKQLGFEEVGFWKDAYGAGEDRLVLELHLRGLDE